MMLVTLLVTILGLSLFEAISSIDNAIINAQVLLTVNQKAKKWFLSYGIIFSVFFMRGFLPWIIVYLSAPSLGPIGALTAAFSGDPVVKHAIAAASPLLFLSSGTFLLFLFLHWLFVEPKSYGLPGERFFHMQSVWFYAVASLVLAILVWLGLQQNSLLAFAAVLGSTAFFMTHGFKENAEQLEQNFLNKEKSDIAKIVFLEIIDATFSVDGVLGAFAFTLAVPLIFLGNGLGAIILRKVTVSNIERISKYIYLKNGAMYSIFFLGLVMILNSFGVAVPFWVSPIVTVTSVGYFFLRSRSLLQINL